MASIASGSLIDDGRYEVGERIGSGGMSEVYAATDTRLGRPVAIKFLKTELDDPAARARIEGEARAAAGLSHPNVVSVYDAGEHGERPYVVMELASSRSLADVIRDRGPLPPGEVRVIGAQVLGALGAAHAQGLVHRDVKPGNILIADDGTAKLADFGIAKAMADAASKMTATGLVMGTPSYLSPEQAAGRPATPRSDLYGMGVVLYEALSGSPPFTGDTPIAVVVAHAQTPVPPLRRAAPEVPAAMAAVVERSLAKDPADRFSDAAEMARALEAVGDDATRPVAAMGATVPLSRPPVAAAERGWLPAALGVGAVVLFIVLLVLALQGGSPEQTVETDPVATTGEPAPATVVPPPTTTTALTPTTRTDSPDGSVEKEKDERGGRGGGPKGGDD